MLKILKLSAFFGLLISIFALSQVKVLAVSDDSSTTTSNKYGSATSMEKRSDNSMKDDKVMAVGAREGSNAAVMIKNKLSESRLRICQSREERISSRFTNLLSLGARVHQNYDGFVARVDYFYLNTLSPEGYTLENYDALKADIATNKAAVNAALTQVRASGQDFSCDSDDPKAQTDAFRANMQVLINANKTYKTSVRAFVVAVRDLAKEARDATLSPGPEVSPEVSPEVTEAPAL